MLNHVNHEAAHLMIQALSMTDENVKTKLDNLHEWITADTTPGLRLLSVTLVVWFAIFLTANTIAYFVG